MCMYICMLVAFWLSDFLAAATTPMDAPLVRDISNDSAHRWQYKSHHKLPFNIAEQTINLIDANLRTHAHAHVHTHACAQWRKANFVMAHSMQISCNHFLSLFDKKKNTPFHINSYRCMYVYIICIWFDI